jgi:hypothetical protein
LAPAINTAVTSTASCPAGTLLLGGGYTVTGNTALSLATLIVTTTDNRPLNTTTWTVTARNYATEVLLSYTVQAFAVCTA